MAGGVQIVELDQPIGRGKGGVAGWVYSYHCPGPLPWVVKHIWMRANKARPSHCRICQLLQCSVTLACCSYRPKLGRISYKEGASKQTRRVVSTMPALPTLYLLRESFVLRSLEEQMLYGFSRTRMVTRESLM